MKIAEILNTGKKKILALTLVSALAVAGTGTVAMAAGVSLPDVFPFLNVKGAENASIVMSSEDGTRYSTNGGKTWSDTEPAGFVQEANTPDGNGVAVDAKIADDGTMLYSTDGGKTWSETAPDGVTASISTPGK